MKEATENCPIFAARVIALASGDIKAIDNARRLPMGVQLIALEKIWNLSIPDGDSLGKLVETVIASIQKLQGNKVFAELANRVQK